MSSRLFQSVIIQMKDSLGKTAGVLDDAGIVIACTDPMKIGAEYPNIPPEVFQSSEVICTGGYSYKLSGSRTKVDFIVFVEGDDEIAKRFCSVLNVSLASVKQFYDEKYDRTNFVKNVILDNILAGDVYLKAKELHYPTESPRAVFVIRLKEPGDYAIFDTISNLFSDKIKDFVVGINETDIALVKEVKPTTDAKELEKIAKNVSDTLLSEANVKSVIGIGTVVTNVSELARSFKEAQVAIEVGKVFDTEKHLINYESLGIGRLIYQLPTTLCEIFLQEVFKKGSIDSLDHETLFTIQKFFENNLNVSETSRKLFVHRNTLVYRLEKIRKITGLDLREFDNAIVFKVALMVNKYLLSNTSGF